MAVLTVFRLLLRLWEKETRTMIFMALVSEGAAVS